jgi:TPR repeat protein
MDLGKAVCVVSFVALSLCGQAAAGPFEDAMTAFTHADYPRTLELVRPLADQGDPRAQNLLGEMYDFGSGVSKDPDKAVELYTMAARQGFAESQFYLGQKSKEPAEAAEWYLKAAQQGFPNAEDLLAALYASGGKGFPRDDAQAAYWWHQAADHGNEDAAGRLGAIYAAGRGVPKDLVQALMWLDLAILGGPGNHAMIYERRINPRTIRDNFAASLTPEQVAEADQRADEWLAQHKK